MSRRHPGHARLTSRAVLAGLAALCAAPAGASPGYSASVELRTPLWIGSPGVSQDPSLVELAGSFRLTGLFGPRGPEPWVKGERTFDQGGFRPENKLLVGVDVSMGRGLILEVYWRRDFNAPVSDRVFVGVRWEIKGRF